MRGLRRIGSMGAFVAAAISSVAAVVAFWSGASVQWLGGLLALALAGTGVGLVGWSHDSMPDESAVGERESLESSDEERQAFVAAFVKGEESISRRRVLKGSLLTVSGGLGALVLSMFRSLGPNPYPVLSRTSWQKGVRLVTDAGQPLKPADLWWDGGVLTVFPEGHTDDTSAQTLLIRVKPDLLNAAPERESWTHEGLIAYSKLCTHAACPVGLYQNEQHLLLCPCHQSTFDVLHGAAPTSGPAARALPQLPLAVNGEGYLVAQADYDVPVGPGFWRRT